MAKISKALQPFLVDIDSLAHDPKNSRGHGERNLTAIAESLDRFGQQKPIIVTSKGVVVAGNGTLEAAKSLGWKEIAAIKTDIKSGKELTAFGVADNRTAELAHWNYEQLAASIEEFDKTIAVGFTGEEIESIILNNEWAGMKDTDLHVEKEPGEDVEQFRVVVKDRARFEDFKAAFGRLVLEHPDVVEAKVQ